MHVEFVVVTLRLRRQYILDVQYRVKALVRWAIPVKRLTNRISTLL